MGKTAISATGSARGFTLVELLVVLAILVGLSAAFPLAWQRLSPQRQLQVYARRMAADLRLLRAQAMQGNAETALGAAAAHAYVLSPQGTVRELPEALSLRIVEPAAAAPAQAAVRFYPDGSSNGGSVVLEREGRQAVLSVSLLAGRVSGE